MIYSSLPFIYGFLPLSLIVYYITKPKFREMGLLMMSMVFCGFIGLKYLGFVMLFCFVNYFCGLFCGISENKAVRCAAYAIGTLFDISCFWFFRVGHLFLFDMGDIYGKTFYPYGVSLFLLSALGYLADIYKKKIRAEKNFVRFSLYIMMFPRLIMGPIIRYSSYKRIIKNKKSSLENIGAGFTIFVKGLAKKVLAADNLYLLYSAVKSVDMDKLSALSAWIGITAYVLCVYFNLSGFTDMGKGICHCFGMNFPKSFNYPMFTAGMRSFSSRWYVQVIRWFRRYLTAPVSSITDKKWLKGVIFVFVWGLTGFWYGMNVRGLIFGLLVGISILSEGKGEYDKFMKITIMVYTFLIINIFSVFLFCDSMHDVIRFFGVMAGRNRIIVDSLTIYLLRSYIVVLLGAAYASTDLFKNVLIRSGKGMVKEVFTAINPLLVSFFLLLCTALIAYSGSSDINFLK